METMFDARIPFFVHWETQYIAMRVEEKVLLNGHGQRTREYGGRFKNCVTQITKTLSHSERTLVLGFPILYIASYQQIKP